VHLCYDIGDLLQAALGCDRLLEVLGAVSLHPVLIDSVADDLLFLHERYKSGVNMQGYTILFAQVPQDGLFTGFRWILRKAHTQR